MLRCSAIFNIVAGLAGVIFSIGLAMLAISLGGDCSSRVDVLELIRFLGPIGIAGILYSWSGIDVWRSLPSVRMQTLVLIGCAFGFGLAYCIQMIASLDGKFGVGGQPRQAGDPYDEEVVMFVFIPMALLLVIAVQWVWLWRRSRR